VDSTIAKFSIQNDNNIFFDQLSLKPRVNEKVSTPTSVILMAFTSCCGKFVQIKKLKYSLRTLIPERTGVSLAIRGGYFQENL
jgi:hypothetical protein